MPTKMEQRSIQEAQVLTVHDVAMYLRLSEAKVYRLAREGSVPAFRLGRSWRFRKDLIDAWMLRAMDAEPVPTTSAREAGDLGSG